MTVTIIRGARLIDGSGARPQPDTDILIRDGRIAAVDHQLRVPPGATVVEGAGQTALPGLIDLSVRFSTLGHLSHNAWLERYAARMRDAIIPAVGRKLVGAGVTGARTLGGNLDDLLWWRAELSNGSGVGPRTVFGGVPIRRADPERPYYNYLVVLDRASARHAVGHLIETLGFDLIKVVADDFETETLRELVGCAHDLGTGVDMTAHRLDAMRRALAAGLDERDSLFHMGVMLEDSEFPADIVVPIVERGVAVVPTVTAGDGLRQIAANPALLEDPAWRRGIPDDMWTDIRVSYDQVREHPLYERQVRTHEARLARLGQLYRAGARFLLGTDSGNRGNPHHAATWRELAAFVEFGMTPLEAITAATSAPAHHLGWDDAGRLAPGRRADILLVQGDPAADITALRRVRAVWQAGVRMT